jgi:hypothetical protein
VAEEEQQDKEKKKKKKHKPFDTGMNDQITPEKMESGEFSITWNQIMRKIADVDSHKDWTKDIGAELKGGVPGREKP